MKVSSRTKIIKTLYFIVCFVLMSLNIALLYNSLEIVFIPKYEMVKVVLVAFYGILFARWLAILRSFELTIDGWTRVEEVLIFWAYWLCFPSALMFVSSEVVITMISVITDKGEIKLEDVAFRINTLYLTISGILCLCSASMLTYYRYRERNVKRGHRWNYMRKLDI